MGTHSKKKPAGRFRTIFAGAVLAGAVAGGVAVWPEDPAPQTPPQVTQQETPWAAPGSSSSTSTDAELPETITLFGQGFIKKNPFLDPINGDWTIALLRQCSELKDPAKKKSYVDFLKQFDDLKQQFHAAGGKSPESIDAIVEKVNQRVSEQIKDHPENNSDFKSPIEMLGNKAGSSQDLAAMNEAVLQYIGLSDNRLLVVRTNSQGDANRGADLDVLVVNDAPEGIAPHFVAVAGHADQLRSTDPHPGQLAAIDARNQRGAFFTIAIPKA